MPIQNLLCQQHVTKNLTELSKFNGVIIDEKELSKINYT